MRVIFTGFFCCLALLAHAGQKVFDFNARCQQAYNAVMQLRMNDARALLDAEKREHPDNLIPYYIDNYTDFFPLFFNEDPQAYAAAESHRKERLSLMSDGPEDSPYYLYTQASIRFQWAFVKVKFNDKWDAVWDIRKAYILLKDNQRKFPGFAPNNLLLGAMQAVFGTIPDGYKWITNILGMKGNIRQGMALVQGVINNNDPSATLFREESYYYYCYLKVFIENKPDDVFVFIRDKQLDTRNNYLFALMVANLAMNNQRASMGIQVLQDRNDSAAYLDLPYANYLLGVMKLERQDADAAGYLEKFVQQFKGKFYVKEAYQRLSWAYLLQGRMDQANRCRQAIFTHGNTETDADKQALKDAKSGNWPQPVLLKARLLSDGGLFAEALKLLQTVHAATFTRTEDKLEYAYRLGRVYDELDQQDRAIAMYEVTIKVGSGRQEYYAARAALQLGYIYEKRNDKRKAAECYHTCISLPDHDYKNSLDHRAKAGLQRIGME
ncbi:Tetratricopeptide repeat-containing protein [Chitinophaga costaii]|uniref:Tetratricopeptide repeat-containing protein n=1 Tax=Chitinophaga costaii TaxID=1335309 RepID=A0A1C4C040_9BACT|nr:tetratricopeptide repeat protein [Chitinophaga costaii]PUZ27395.1 tetratricopeptide repeat protein [Chitinophaga costaii]SCC12499.1 Tetratricopeptide repeat-containing protein [Chitinophaga costaii]